MVDNYRGASSGSNGNNIYRTWGKSRLCENAQYSFHRLVYHCLDAAAVGDAILTNNPILFSKLQELTNIHPSYLHPLVRFFLAAHDIGKVSEQFQNIYPELHTHLTGKTSRKRYTLHHTAMGAVLWNSLWGSLWSNNDLHVKQGGSDKCDWQIIFDSWSLASMGHHGRPPPPEEIYHYPNENDVKEAYTLLHAFSELFFSEIVTDDMPAFDEELEYRFKHASWLLAGLIVLSDWIASDEQYFSYHEEIMPLAKYWNTIAVPAAFRAMEALNFVTPLVKSKQDIRALLPVAAVPTPLQRCVSSIELSPKPQLHIIEDVTGSGKTEAALHLSYRMMKTGIASGLFFALPTMATSDAMYARIEVHYKSLYEKAFNPTLMLTHSRKRTTFHGSYHKYGDMNIGADWLANNKKKALLSHVGVGTIDQALMAVLPQKHQSLRLLGLARNVLVVDEVHAYDPYMHTLLCTLLQFHALLGGSAILLSATLPHRTREELLCSYARGREDGKVMIASSPYPLLTSYCDGALQETPLGASIEKHITISFVHSMEDVLSCIKDSYDVGKCTCWIRNTVDDAVEAYNAVIRAIPEAHVILFHARYAFADRSRIQEDVLQRFGKEGTPEMRRGTVLIATQVVEQSLDLDFDSMITDLAPIDLILQRAGRLHRFAKFHTGDSTPILRICGPPFEEVPSES